MSEILRQMCAAVEQMLDESWVSSLENEADNPALCPHCGEPRMQYGRPDRASLRWVCVPCERKRQQEARATCAQHGPKTAYPEPRRPAGVRYVCLECERSRYHASPTTRRGHRKTPDV